MTGRGVQPPRLSAAEGMDRCSSFAFIPFKFLETFPAASVFFHRSATGLCLLAHFPFLLHTRYKAILLNNDSTVGTGGRAMTLAHTDETRPSGATASSRL